MNRLDRRTFLTLAGMATAASFARPLELFGQAPVDLEEMTIAAMQDGDARRAASPRAAGGALSRRGSRRIDKRGPALNSIIELNPDALAIADALDAERKAGRVRGPLHGIPILIKDNIDTADRMTHDRRLAGAGGVDRRRATRIVVERLREAGAVILGKTNLSEWANFRSTHSSSGWSGRGGQTRNPYALDRNPCGSSSGSGAAVAANFAAVGVGTETDGSIVCPVVVERHSSASSRPSAWSAARGIIPISHSQDTAGPMARTVADAAILLGALTGVDPRDAATAASRGHVAADYTQFLDANGLRGARIGVARGSSSAISDAADKRRSTQAIDAIEAHGATIVDPADIATAGKFDDSEFEVLLYEFKADLNAYLAGSAPNAPVRTLADVIAFNERERDARDAVLRAGDLRAWRRRRGRSPTQAYQEALAKNHRLSRARRASTR